MTDSLNIDSSRKLIEEHGYDVSEDTLDFIKCVEDKAYPEEMKLMQGAEDMGDIAYIYGAYVRQITIARNKDWYIIYCEKDGNIEISDVASLPTRDVEASRREIHDYIVGVINAKAKQRNIPVILCAKEDTSYKMILRMVRNNEFEIIRDIIDTWDYDSAIRMHDLILRPLTDQVNKMGKN